MKKLIYLCSTVLLISISVAQARVEFIAKDDGISFKSPKSAGCPEGMRNYSGKCVSVCKKNEYPFATKPDSKKGNVETCSGIPPRYRYTECHDGYEGTSNGDCVLRDCSAYPLKESEINRHIGHVEFCQSGNDTTYRYTSCNSVGWVLDNNKCVERNCAANKYPYDYSVSVPNSKVGSSELCQSGDKTFWGYTSCIQPDWKEESGQCWNQCTGYNSLTDVIDNCIETSYCVTKAGTKYKCTAYSVSIACSPCSVGSVLYTGGTCDASCASGEAVGVVIDPNSRLIYALIEFDGERGVSSAEERCHGKTWGGYTWRLPTLSESTTIMNNISAIQGSLNNVGTPVSDRGYWTSTEYSGSCGSEPCNYDYHVLSANHAQSPAYRSQSKPFRCVANYNKVEPADVFSNEYDTSTDNNASVTGMSSFDVDNSITNNETSSGENSDAIDVNNSLLILLNKFRSIAYFPEGGKIEGKLKEQYRKVLSQKLRTKENFPVLLEYYGVKEDKNLAVNVMTSWLFAMTLSEIFPEKRNDLYKLGYVVGKDEPIYGRSFNSDLNISRLIASIIYSQTHDFDDVEKMRKEVGKSLGKCSGNIPDDYYIALDEIIPSPPVSYSSDDEKDRAFNSIIIEKYSLTSSTDKNFERAVQATADDDGNAAHLFGDTHKVTVNGQDIIISPVFGKHNIDMEINPNSAIAETVVGLATECSWSRDPSNFGWTRIRPGQGDAKSQKVLANYDIDAADGHFTHGCTLRDGYEECVKEKPISNSYPSGHSAYIWCAAMILSEIIPDKTEVLMQTANEYALNRTVARYHWTSDTIIGRVAGSAFLPVAYAIDYSSPYVNCMKKLKKNKNANCSF